MITPFLRLRSRHTPHQPQSENLRCIHLQCLASLKSANLRTNGFHNRSGDSCIVFATFQAFLIFIYLSRTFSAVICSLSGNMSSFTLWIQSAGLPRKRSWFSSIQARFLRFATVALCRRSKVSLVAAAGGGGECSDGVERSGGCCGGGEIAVGMRKERSTLRAS